MILSSAEARLKAKIEEAGTPLKDWDVSIYRGILTGFNEAFIINGATKEKLISQSPESAEIIHPVVEGKDIKRHRIEKRDLWIIFSRKGVDMEQYPAVKEHLNGYFHKLKPRNNGELFGRKPGPYEWYEIQDNVAYYKKFDLPKIVWGNLNVRPSFALADEGVYVNAPSNFLTSETVNIFALLGVLNSSVSSFFLKQIAYSREGGYFEYKKQFVEQMPIPLINDNLSSKLEGLCAVAIDRCNRILPIGDVEKEIDMVLYDAYHLSETDRLYISRHI